MDSFFKRKYFVILLVFTQFLFSANGQDKKRPNVYKQDFKIKEALFVKERNGAPYAMGTAFLIDKERGLFASAKHVGIQARDVCKIFFNGRVYNAFLLKLPPITDVGIIKIDGPFDPSDFPEPYKFASKINKGDKTFTRGIHPHPKKYQDAGRLLPLMRGYYFILGRDGEFVYDNLEGEISDLDKRIENKKIGGSSKMLADVTSSYIELKMKKDHHFSFGGLSGGPTVNDREEVVGINSSEVGGYLEITEDGKAQYHPWTTFHLVSISELIKLLPQALNVK